MALMNDLVPLLLLHFAVKLCQDEPAGATVRLSFAEVVADHQSGADLVRLCDLPGSFF